MARDSMLDGCGVCIGIVDFTKKRKLSHTISLCGIKSNNNEYIYVVCLDASKFSAKSIFFRAILTSYPRSTVISSVQWLATEQLVKRH